MVVAGEELRQAIGRPVRYFAFPFGLSGHLNRTVFKLAHEFGYDGVCSAYGGYNFPGDDPFHLQRICADEMLRVKNWVTVDPRKMRRPYRFDYQTETDRKRRERRRRESQPDFGSAGRGGPLSCRAAHDTRIACLQPTHLQGREAAGRNSEQRTACGTDSLAASVAILVVLSIAQRLIGFARQILVCRWLEPNQLGEWDICFKFLMLGRRWP